MSALSVNYRYTQTYSGLHIFNNNIDLDIAQTMTNSSNTIIMTALPDNFILPSNVSMTILKSSKAYLKCSKDFPFIKPEQKSISLKQIIDIPLVISSETFDFQDTLITLLKQHGKPQIKLVAPNLFTATAAVNSGVVAGFTNKLYNTESDKKLRFLSIRNTPQFNLILLYPKNTPSSIISELSELLKQYLD